jgi:hypothetical protein
MVIYEVNLKVNNEIFTKFIQWLSLHIEEVLKFPGFVKALYLRDFENDDECQKNISVHYYLNSPKSLDIYLEKHAPVIRQEGLLKFPNQFSSSYRVLEVQEEILA